MKQYKILHDYAGKELEKEVNACAEQGYVIDRVLQQSDRKRKRDHPFPHADDFPGEAGDGAVTDPRAQQRSRDRHDTLGRA